MIPIPYTIKSQVPYPQQVTGLSRTLTKLPLTLQDRDAIRDPTLVHRCFLRLYRCYIGAIYGLCRII